MNIIEHTTWFNSTVDISRNKHSDDVYLDVSEKFFSFKHTNFDIPAVTMIDVSNRFVLLEITWYEK